MQDCQQYLLLKKQGRIKELYIMLLVLGWSSEQDMGCIQELYLTWQSHGIWDATAMQLETAWLFNDIKFYRPISHGLRLKINRNVKNEAQQNWSSKKIWKSKKYEREWKDKGEKENRGRGEGHTKDHRFFYNFYSIPIMNGDCVLI